MPEWLDRLLRRPPRDKRPPEAFTPDGATTLALGTLTIPLSHSGKDVSGGTEQFGATFAKLYKNPGKTPVPCTATPLTGTPLKTTVTAVDVDVIAGTTTFEVTAIDAAGNEGPSLAITSFSTVDAKAPVAFISDGGAIFTPK